MTQYLNLMDNKWIASWSSKQHQDKKKMMFDVVDSRINITPTTILDISRHICRVIKKI